MSDDDIVNRLRNSAGKPPNRDDHELEITDWYASHKNWDGFAYTGECKCGGTGDELYGDFESDVAHRYEVLHLDVVMAESPFDDMLREAAVELERLRQWQQEAIEVDDQWETLFQMIPTKPTDLGRRKRDIVLDEILRLRAKAGE